MSADTTFFFTSFTSTVRHQVTIFPALWWPVLQLLTMGLICSISSPTSLYLVSSLKNIPLFIFHNGVCACLIAMSLLGDVVDTERCSVERESGEHVKCTNRSLAPSQIFHNPVLLLSSSCVYGRSPGSRSTLYRSLSTCALCLCESLIPYLAATISYFSQPS